MFKDESNENPAKKFYGFHQGCHLHYIIKHDSITNKRVILLVLSVQMIHYMEGHFTVLSIEMISSIQKASRRHHVAKLKTLSSFGTKDGIKRKNHASRVNIHASRKIMHHERKIMHCGNSCIMRENSCIAESHALRKVMHCGEEVMHCKINSWIMN